MGKRKTLYVNTFDEISIEKEIMPDANSLQALYSRRKVYDFFGNESLQNNVKYKAYKECYAKCQEQIEARKTHYKELSKIFTNTVVNNEDKRIIDKIENKYKTAISYCEEIEKEEFCFYEKSELTLRDIMVYFTKRILEFDCTKKEDIVDFFGVDIFDRHDKTTLKDNWRDAESDNVYLMNLAVLLTVEHEKQKLPFRIIENEEKYVDSNDITDRNKKFEYIYKKLKEEDVRNITLSEEIVTAGLYRWLQNDFEQLQRMLIRIIKMIRAVKLALFQTEYIKELEILYIKPSYQELVELTVHTLSENVEMKNDELKHFMHQEQKTFENLLETLKGMFTEFEKEYFELLPSIIKSTDEEYWEEFTRGIEDAEYQINEILENRTIAKDKFMKLIALYNQAKMPDNWIISIYNVASIEDKNMQNNFMSIFMEMTKHLSIKETDVSQNTLRQLLQESKMSVADMCRLAYLNFETMTDMEWEFLMKYAVVGEEKWYDSFCSLVLAYNGENAIINVSSLDEKYQL